ncbi:MAG TPA: SDR family NAD(P)-dependent oxidoreductase [Solirubrobacteraceae bacterium]|jgi:UDP-glucose 4-epimerase|nr:SDR family NAD(P)-dependent oxidoreductase [Solirubrobacteraceae bacterium]
MTTSSLRGERVLVTGGAGTIGSHIVDQLVDAGAEQIIVLDNFVRGRRENLSRVISHPSVRIVDGDICDRDLVTQLTRGIDVVFHQAALRITQCAEEPRLALEVLVDGTFNVVDAAAREGVRKLIAASSASIYGLADEFPTAENHHPYANDTLYGAAKTFNEGLLRSYHAMTGLDYVALRYFNVYGARMDVHGLYTEVLVRWMERIVEGKPPLIFGSGAQTMDFVYVEDIARANILAATADVTDQVFNVASGTETSLVGLAERLLAVMDSDLSIEFGPERAVNKVSRRLADTTAAKEHLGFTAEIGVDEGLTRLVEWWRAERARTSSTELAAA